MARLPVPVVAGDRHLLHDPAYVVEDGRVLTPARDRPERVERMRAALEAAGHPMIGPVEHGTDPLLSVHRPELLQFLEAAWDDWRTAGGPEVLIPDTFAIGRGIGGAGPDEGDGRGPWRPTTAGRGRPGWFCTDTATPLVAGTWAAARSSADIALTAADLVRSGAPAVHALCRPPGHHAGPGYYGGFCFLNNVAIAARSLRDLGPLAIVDVDFHHGNGTQHVFWEDGSVLYASLHGDPGRHYPYFSGAADEVGGGAGRGATLNLPLPDGTAGHAYLGALETLLERVDRFHPAALLVSLGLDGDAADPLGTFELGVGDYAAIGERLAQLGPPTILVQEGGYALDALGADLVAVLAALSSPAEGDPPIG